MADPDGPRAQRRRLLNRRAPASLGLVGADAEAKISLARADLAAGRRADARVTIEAALATPWDTAELHAVAAAVFRAAGDPEQSTAERARAAAIDPHAVE